MALIGWIQPLITSITVRELVFGVNAKLKAPLARVSEEVAPELPPIFSQEPDSEIGKWIYNGAPYTVTEHLIDLALPFFGVNPAVPGPERNQVIIPRRIL